MTTSTATLSAIRDRVERGLMDTSNLIWASADLDEAIRRALSRISLACGGARQTLNGLDGATVTSLQEEDELVLLTGAEFYAAFSRALDRMESPNLNEDAPLRFLEWLGRIGKRYTDQLELLRRRRLQTGASPVGALEWDESGPVW